MVQFVMSSDGIVYPMPRISQIFVEYNDVSNEYNIMSVIDGDTICLYSYRQRFFKDKDFVVPKRAMIITRDFVTRLLSHDHGLFVCTDEDVFADGTKV